MNYKQFTKVAVVTSLLATVSACSWLGIDTSRFTDRTTSVDKYKKARATNNPEKLIVQRQGHNPFGVYFGRKSNKGSGKDIIEAGSEKYQTSSVHLDRNDIKMAFVARTNDGQPALGLRLKPGAVAKLSSANKSGFKIVLASMNDAVFSKVDGAGAKLADGVLLLPMPTLVSARDAANVVRVGVE